MCFFGLCIRRMFHQFLKKQHLKSVETIKS